jgi:hypothetical protein
VLFYLFLSTFFRARFCPTGNRVETYFGLGFVPNFWGCIYCNIDLVSDENLKRERERGGEERVEKKGS